MVTVYCLVIVKIRISIKKEVLLLVNINCFSAVLIIQLPMSNNPLLKKKLREVEMFYLTNTNLQ